ncbi:Vgb family protein [Deinococcus multiflagellatus]|uniref:Vgb family protein n=1 Tax=Deinococcus multiflagellatus TaxID=1656887 RepID=UPI001CCE87E8|nr:hypothetical protein [Deinococcus multiflagellatus]MBZ9714176.1 hypothetical protein [Deinococcus multiflagellatus]
MTTTGLMRSLTAPARRPRRPGLGGALLLASLLLACGGAPGGGGTPPPGGQTGTLTVTLERVPVVGEAAQPGALRLRGTPPAGVKVTVEAAPPGVQLAPGAPTAEGSDTLVTLNPQGQGGGTVTLQVSAPPGTARLNVPVLAQRRWPIPGTTPYLAAAARPAPDGTLLLRAPANAEASARHSLLQFDPAQGRWNTLDFGLQGFETITSHTVISLGTRGTETWVAVRGVTAAGSFLVRRDSAGTLTRFLAGTPETLNALTPTLDGRLQFLVYGQPQVLALDPASGTVSRVPTDGVPETLVALEGGRLAYTRRGAAPAVVTLDPQTGAARTFAVGTANVSVPDLLTPAPDGTLWLAETRTGAVLNLDPRSGTTRTLSLPAGTRPSALAAAPDGTLWVADATRATLLRVAPGASSGAAVALPPGTPTGPRALTVTSDGAAWFESGGQWTRLGS